MEIKMVITVGEKEIVLTSDEMKELKETLDKLFVHETEEKNIPFVSVGSLGSLLEAFRKARKEDEKENEPDFSGEISTNSQGEEEDIPQVDEGTAVASDNTTNVTTVYKDENGDIPIPLSTGL